MCGRYTEGRHRPEKAEKALADLIHRQWPTLVPRYNVSPGTHIPVIRLHAETGAELWSQNLFSNSTSTPAVRGGRVFIGSDSGKLFALDAVTGTPIWSFTTGAEVYSAPAVSGDGKVNHADISLTRAARGNSLP